MPFFTAFKHDGSPGMAEKLDVAYLVLFTHCLAPTPMVQQEEKIKMD